MSMVALAMTQKMTAIICLRGRQREGGNDAALLPVMPASSGKPAGHSEHPADGRRGDDRAPGPAARQRWQRRFPAGHAGPGLPAARYGRQYRCCPSLAPVPAAERWSAPKNRDTFPPPDYHRGPEPSGPPGNTGALPCLHNRKNRFPHGERAVFSGQKATKNQDRHMPCPAQRAIAGTNYPTPD